MSSGEPDMDFRRRRWEWIGRICSAHVIALHEAGVIDDDSFGALLQAVDSTRQGAHPVGGTVHSSIAAFDERVVAISPNGLGGALGAGRGSIDLAAAVVRRVQREQLLVAAGRLDLLRAALIDFASAHVVTLMPAHVDGEIAQPATLGHWLGGIIGALGRASSRLSAAYAVVNQSPLGSGALASTGMPIDRERVAELTGFDGVIANTYDAVSATDHVAAIADVIAAVTTPVRRWCEELLVWMRAEPGSFTLADDWVSFVTDIPQGRFPSGLVALATNGRLLESRAASLRASSDGQPYGPIAGALDALAEASEATLIQLIAFLDSAIAFVTGGLKVNRALLANRAGKAFSTSSDLADFLMIEEQIDPGSARNIAALTISRARDQGLEAAGITPELIDGAALLVIGREIKVEFEAISRYLAPRRFIERRTATGAPSPASTRAYLDAERAHLAEASNWRASAEERQRRAEAVRTSIETGAIAAVRG